MRRNRAGVAGQFENVHASIGAVDDVDIAAIIGLHVIGLDYDLAAVLTIHLDATLVGRRRDPRNEISDFFRVVRIADVNGAHAGIEVAEKDDSFI